MFTAPVNKHRRGFTLLEIMIAVAILGLMAVAIYRFVQSNVIAMRVSAEATAADSLYESLRDLLTAQLQSLPAGSGALVGEPLKLNDRSRDELRWTSGAGLGVLTRYAPTDFTVAMRIKPDPKDNDRFELGLLRKPKDELYWINKAISSFQAKFQKSRRPPRAAVSKLSKKIAHFTGLADKKGNSVFQTPPLDRWLKRKDVVQGKMG